MCYNNKITKIQGGIPLKVSAEAVERFKEILRDQKAEDSAIRIFLSGG